MNNIVFTFAKICVYVAAVIGAPLLVASTVDSTFTEFNKEAELDNISAGEELFDCKR